MIILHEKIKLDSHNRQITRESEKTLKQQSEQLKKDKLVTIGQITSHIAHNLRNPLSSMKNTVEIMEIEFEKNQNDNLKMNLERLGRGISRMVHDVEDVLGFVRIIPLELEKTSLRRIIETSINRLNTSSIKIKLPTNDIEIICDHSRLEIAFLNILQNSIEAMNNNGQIKIRLIDNNSEAIIEFENNGTAISEEVLPKIFDPLFTTKQTGTGLGLSITKNIVQQHNGTITVKNNPVVFTVKFPYKKLFKLYDNLNKNYKKWRE